jgi:hypothetical protein
MPFRPEDIEPAGQVPNSTEFAYTVARDGEMVGRVHAPQVPGWLNAGQDPREQIARRHRLAPVQTLARSRVESALCRAPGHP